MSNENRTSISEWLEQYAKEPIKKPTKEEAFSRLRRIGVVDNSGNVDSRYVGVIKHVLKGEQND